MKKYRSSIIALLVILIVLIVVAIKVSTTEPTEIGGGTNTDISQTAYVKSNLTEEAREKTFGKVLHKGVISKDVIIQGVRIDAGITAINFISRTKPVSIVTLACESRSDSWDVAHNTYDAQGDGVEDATSVSIMNYPKGVSDIRELDEVRGPVFSTANGDEEIYKALLSLKDLDPESTVAFTFETEDAVGEAHAVGWSALFKVKDVVAGLKKVDLQDCKKAVLPQGGLDIQFMSNESLRAIAAAKK